MRQSLTDRRHSCEAFLVAVENAPERRTRRVSADEAAERLSGLYGVPAEITLRPTTRSRRVRQGRAEDLA